MQMYVYIGIIIVTRRAPRTMALVWAREHLKTLLCRVQKPNGRMSFGRRTHQKNMFPRKTRLLKIPCKRLQSIYSTTAAI